MRHLTFTGFYAGTPLCGASRLAEDYNVHYTYAPEWMLRDSGTCSGCRDEVASLDDDNDDEVEDDLDAYEGNDMDPADMVDETYGL